MQFITEFVPLSKMIDRTQTAKEESDTTYFYDLMLLGELLFKIIVTGIVSGIENDKDRNRYRQLHRLVRADGIGEWSSVLDETLNGVSSQFLQKSITQNEQKELQTKVRLDTWQYQSVAYLVNVFDVLKMDQIQLPDRIQGRLWFGYFAQLRNATRGHGAPQPSQCGAACQNLEKSIFLFVENFHLFRREWVYLHQNLNGKYRVTTLNKSASKFENLKRTKLQPIFPNGVYVFFDCETSVELIYSDADAFDFFLPNGNFKEKNFELLSYISNKRQSVENSLYLTPANELPRSETQGLGELNVQGNCLGNIPPLSSEYVSRRGLENDLKRVLEQEDRYPVVTLRGRGGIGKTTLAISVIHELSNSNRFDLVLWFSSRDIDLKLEGPKPVKNMMLTEIDVAEEFLRLIGSKEHRKNIEKINYLGSQMADSSFGKILFVFDNFETVQNPTEFFSWIDTYIRNPNKALITSRISKNFKADYPIEIIGMEENESRELISQTSKSLGIDTYLTSEVIEKLIEESQGHPYVMKILLGQIAKNPKGLQIERIMASQEDILIALFRRTFNTLTPAAKRIFLTLCSWRSVVPAIALEAVLLRPEIVDRLNVDEAIEELQKSSFVDLISSNNDSSTFLSVPLAAFLFGKSELEVSPMKLAILNDRELLFEFGATQQLDIQNGILPRIERKFRAVAKRVYAGEESIDVHKPVLEFLCRKFPFAWTFLYQLYVENSQLKDAEDALREYLKYDLQPDDKKSVLQQISILNNVAGDWLAEVTTLTELCLLPNSTLEEISETANIINNYIYKDDNHSPRLTLDNDIKESLIKKVVEIMQKKINTATFVTATDYSRIAWLYMHLQQVESAKEAVEMGLAKDFSNAYCKKLAIKFQML
ncbi:MAG: NB-ARC domain-containing protein [Chitinophagaceae bacterium]